MQSRTVLAVRSADDAVLHHIAPIGLAASRPTALVVDLDTERPSYPAGLTLARLLENGPRRTDLLPPRRGVAVVGNGGVGPEEAADLVEALSRGWPAVVVRAGVDPLPYPVVPVVGLLRGALAPTPKGPAAFQAVSRFDRLPGPGLLLPPVRRAQIDAMVAGRVEPRWRWVRAWGRAWGMPWE